MQHASDIERIKDKVSLSSLIGEYTKLTKKGDHYVGLCPFHSEKTPSFQVHDHRGAYHCFGCGAHGDVINFLTTHQKLTFKEALETLALKAGITLTSFNKPLEEERGGDIKKILGEAAKWYAHQLSLNTGERARLYLEQRGVASHIVDEFRLGYAPSKGLRPYLNGLGISDRQLQEAGLIIFSSDSTREPFERFRHRLMFPIQNAKGDVIASGGRLLVPSEKEAKYLNSPELSCFKKSEHLYSWQRAIKVRDKTAPLLVVEGYMDVISLFQAGYQGVVAPLGTALTETHIQQLWQHNPTPILCFDGDQAGLNASFRSLDRILPLLKPGHSFKFCFLPKGHDPDSLIQQGRKAHFDQLILNATNLMDVLWNRLLEQHPLHTPEEKAGFKAEFSKVLSVIQDKDVSHLYGQEFFARWQQVVSPFKNKVKKNKNPYLEEKLDGLLDVERLREKILLATLINHPKLISIVAEKMATISFVDKKLDLLRKELFNIYAGDSSILVHSLKEQLIALGFEECLLSLFGGNLYGFCPFVRDTAPDEEALKGWEELFERHQKGLLEKEVEGHTARLKEAFDADAWERWKKLKSLLLLQQ